MDDDHSGLISIDELKMAYKKLNPEIKDEVIEEIIKRIDYDGNK
jgi:Ca2+-binding EF-hand superfamily protein